MIRFQLDKMKKVNKTLKDF